jgi:hypothetical protein
MIRSPHIIPALIFATLCLGTGCGQTEGASPSAYCENCAPRRALGEPLYFGASWFGFCEQAGVPGLPDPGDTSCDFQTFTLEAECNLACRVEVRKLDCIGRECLTGEELSGLEFPGRASIQIVAEEAGTLVPSLTLTHAASGERAVYDFDPVAFAVPDRLEMSCEFLDFGTDERRPCGETIVLGGAEGTIFIKARLLEGDQPVSASLDMESEGGFEISARAESLADIFPEPGSCTEHYPDGTECGFSADRPGRLVVRMSYGELTAERAVTVED